MTSLLYFGAPAVACYDNDNSAFIPEIWANEGLVILEENMVMANLVHRDFENEIRDFGDVVNTRRPGTFGLRRKANDGDAIENQDATATNVRVPLDQWFYTSFTIKDGEASKSFQDLVDIYLLPGMQTIARSVDRAILGRIPAYLGTTPGARAGQLTQMNDTNSKDFVLNARQILNINKAYPTNRNLVLSPYSETALLQNELFIAAQQRGDGGNALENATLGRILGFDTYLDQNVNAVTGNADVEGFVVTNALAAGVTPASQTISGPTDIFVTGEFVTVVGNYQPTFITAHAETSSATTSITLNETNAYATQAGAVGVRYKSCTVDNSAGYAAGYSGTIALDGWDSGFPPQVGQMMAFGTGGSRATYTVIESYAGAGSDQLVLLDRPLDNAITNNQAAFPGPYGSFNWAFHREAVALVSRPLALPNGRMGVMSDVAVHNDISMRVTMQYNISMGGTVVNLDLLAGVAVLDTRLCVPLLG